LCGDLDFDLLVKQASWPHGQPTRQQRPVPLGYEAPGGCPRQIAFCESIERLAGPGRKIGMIIFVAAHILEPQGLPFEPFFVCFQPLAIRNQCSPRLFPSTE
jgi:hypothetical protein